MAEYKLLVVMEDYPIFTLCTPVSTGSVDEGFSILCIIICIIIISL